MSFFINVGTSFSILLIVLKYLSLIIFLWVNDNDSTIYPKNVDIIKERNILAIWVLKLLELSFWFISYMASSLKNKAFTVNDKLKLNRNNDILTDSIL